MSRVVIISPKTDDTTELCSVSKLFYAIKHNFTFIYLPNIEYNPLLIIHEYLKHYDIVFYINSYSMIMHHGISILQLIENCGDKPIIVGQEEDYSNIIVRKVKDNQHNGIIDTIIANTSGTDLNLTFNIILEQVPEIKEYMYILPRKETISIGIENYKRDQTFILNFKETNCSKDKYKNLTSQYYDNINYDIYPIENYKNIFIKPSSLKLERQVSQRTDGPHLPDGISLSPLVPTEVKEVKEVKRQESKPRIHIGNLETKQPISITGNLEVKERKGGKFNPIGTKWDWWEEGKSITGFMEFTTNDKALTTWGPAVWGFNDDGSVKMSQNGYTNVIYFDNTGTTYTLERHDGYFATGTLKK